MKQLSALCPSGPDWHLDWDAIDAAFSWVRDLALCEQDPRWHAEGNVWIHTRMACRALIEDPAFRALEPAEREVCFAAILMHDVAKPACTKVEDDGAISSRGHSGRGERMARRLLWEMTTPFAAREQVTALIRFHQLPFYLIDREDAARRVHAMSQVVRCDLLALVARADGRGRVCQDAGDRTRMLDNTDLFVELCREQRCLDRARAFPSDHSRFLYFRKPDRDPGYEAHDDTRCVVTVMSGMPGAGKDTWLGENLPDQPVVSLDQVRETLGIGPEESQGRVVSRARDMAREHLRASRSFAWNATNVSRDLRGQLINLFADYNARVNIVYVEAAESELWRRNNHRDARVPPKVIERMLGRWTIPDPTEAHQIRHVIHGEDV